MYTIWNYICELPAEVQNMIETDMRRYYESNEIEWDETVMDEKLVNILNISDELMDDYGFSIERYESILAQYNY